MTDYYGPENEQWRAQIAAFNRQHGPWRGTVTKSTLPIGWERMSLDALWYAVNQPRVTAHTIKEIMAKIKI